MKYRFSRADAMLQASTPVGTPAPPEQGPPEPGCKRPMLPTGLIFATGNASSPNLASDAVEPDDICKTAQAWGWCEWVRMSLVAAALIAAGVVMAGKTLAQRTRANNIQRLDTPAWQTRTAEDASDISHRRSPDIGRIHYWSDDHSTTVTVDLQRLVYFEAHRLTRPDRIYFDLRTRTPENLQGRVIQVGVGEPFLRKIRVAERGPGVTRVVLETTPNCDYSAMIAPDPYRLVVKLHAPQ